MKVKPREGLNVRHPETGSIIKGECEIVVSPQVKRLLKDGDLIEVVGAPKKQPKTEPKQKDTDNE